MKTFLTILIGCGISSMSAYAQCVSDETSITSFEFNFAKYEVVKENRSWVDAVACAVERGGMLAEVDSQEEQDAIFNHILNDAGIDNTNTVASDGGGASYVWLGGHDRTIERAWIWDGNNDSFATQFWEGNADGVPIDGLYNNWGNEPDDFGIGQDALGLALTDWPRGVAGEWNDLNENNELYYVIEYEPDIPSGIGDTPGSHGLALSPNPASSNLYVELPFDALTPGLMIKAFDTRGVLVALAPCNSLRTHVDVSALPQGSYIIRIENHSGAVFIGQFVIRR